MQYKKVTDFRVRVIKIKLNIVDAARYLKYLLFMHLFEYFVWDMIESIEWLIIYLFSFFIFY
jgi:hypothetical protein